MKEQIKIQAQVKVWQEYYVDVPDGMTKEEFIEKLKKENDPSANHYENGGIETLFETEKLIQVEYYDENDKYIGWYSY